VTLPDVDVLNAKLYEAIRDGYIVTDGQGDYAVTELGVARGMVLAQAGGWLDVEFEDTTAAMLSLVAYGNPHYTKDEE
jgi:hypothetical protein